tara:strand:+ start:5366 stop:5761 length:396 start_codon:yes stop_codon:yes gene_type:complete
MSKLYRIPIESLKRSYDTRRDRVMQQSKFGMNLDNLLNDYDNNPSNPKNAPTMKDIEQVKKTSSKLKEVLKYRGKYFDKKKYEVFARSYAQCEIEIMYLQFWYDHHKEINGLFSKLTIPDETIEFFNKILK